MASHSERPTRNAPQVPVKLCRSCRRQRWRSLSSPRHDSRERPMPMCHDRCRKDGGSARRHNTRGRPMPMCQQRAEHAQHGQRKPFWTRFLGMQYRAFAACRLALVWLVAACTVDWAAPAGAADKSHVHTLTLKKTSATDRAADIEAGSPHAADELLAAARADHYMLPAGSEHEAQVLTALQEGILLRGRDERSGPDHAPALYVKSIRLPSDWFRVSLTPAEDPVARRVTPHTSWSSRKLAAASRAASLDQPNLTDYRLEALHERMPAGSAELPSPTESAGTVLPAASWEAEHEPSQPIGRKGNPLRGPVRQVKGNPLRQSPVGVRAPQRDSPLQ